MKQFVSGGCSFSECVSLKTHTWPMHLWAKLPDYTHIPRAMGSIGNGLISRRVIYTLCQLLKQHDPDKILVGIMWSGPDRHEYYNPQIPEYIRDAGEKHLDTYGMENPTNVVTEKHWVVLNDPWRHNNDRLVYYTHFHDHIGALVYTYEHILRTQWFLKSHGIKYFMSTYNGSVFPDHAKNHNEIAHLLEQINFDKFLPVTGEYEWCRDHSGLAFPVKGDDHPGTAQHKLFTEQVIWPFLEKNNYLE